jgi:hypothetical protein
MPSHSASSALIKLYGLGELPWNFPTWQDITGVKHGLFPDDDRHLPKGWTRHDANDIKSYFDQYQQKPTEEQKIKFASAARDGGVPGRKKWTDFVSKSWQKWNVHGKIVEALHKHGVHPITILEQEGSLDSWPNADMYVPIAIDTIAMSLFGVEAFNDADILPYNLRKCLTIFVQRSWARIRAQVVKDRAKLPEIEASALRAFESSFHNQGLLFKLTTVLTDLNKESVTKADIFATIRAVSKWKDIAEVYGTKDNLLKADHMLAELNRLMEGLGVRVQKCKAGTGKRRSYSCVIAHYGLRSDLTFRVI